MNQQENDMTKKRGSSEQTSASRPEGKRGIATSRQAEGLKGEGKERKGAAEGENSTQNTNRRKGGSLEQELGETDLKIGA